MMATKKAPPSEDQIRARIDRQIRRDRARALIMQALREREPRTSRELREIVAAETGETGRRVAADVGAALKSLDYRQLAHYDDDGWRSGSSGTRRRHPLSVRGPCPDCGELHLSGPCPPG